MPRIMGHTGPEYQGPNLVTVSYDQFDIDKGLTEDSL